MRSAEVLEEVAAEHWLDVADLTGPSRLTHVVAARHEAMRRLRRKGYTLVAIGALVGGRDHTTVVHALKKWGAEPMEKVTTVTVDLDEVTAEALTAWAAAEDRPVKNAAGIAIKAFLAAQHQATGEFPERYQVIRRDGV